MKIKRFLLGGLLSLAMSLGIGATLISTNTYQKEAATVEAGIPSQYTNIYRFTVPNSFGSDVGNHIYLHAWGSNGGDTSWGNFITLSDYSYNENSERVYLYLTDYTYTGFIIIRYSDNPNYCKTQDIICGSNKAWSWNGNNGASASAWTAENPTFYLYDYKNMFNGEAKCYAWQSGGSLINAAYPGVAMTKVQYGSGQLYSVSLDPAFDKVIFGVGDSANTGDQWCNQKRGQTFCWWDAGDGSWSNDLDWVKAHDWIYQTMHMRDIQQTDTGDSGNCRGSSGYYAKAKTAYTNYSAAIKAKMAADDLWGAAQTRFIAWAKANGETASFSNTTLTVRSNTVPSIFSFKTNDNNAIIPIVIVATLVSVSAVGGFFLLRKRKEN